MKRLITALVCLCLSFGANSGPANSAGENVSIEVLTSTGARLSDDYSTVGTSFLSKTVKIVNGEVRMSLPDGKHTFFLNTSAGLQSGNLVSNVFSFELEVLGKTTARVQLPPVKEIVIELEDSYLKDGFVDLAMSSFDVRETPNNRRTGSLNSPRPATVTSGSINFKAVGSGGYLEYGTPTPSGLYISAERGLRVKDGKIRFWTFEPSPLRELGPRYEIPAVVKQFDFDDDGFGDYSYSYRYGQGYKTATISHAALYSGAPKLKLEGLTSVQVDEYAGTLNDSAKTLIVTGKLRAASPVFLQPNSKVFAQMLYNFNGRIYNVRIGEALVEPNGSFKFNVNLRNRQIASAITPNFFIQADSGAATLDLAFPNMANPRVSIKWVGSDARFTYSGLPAWGTVFYTQTPSGLNLKSTLDSQSGTFTIKGFAVSNEVTLQSVFYTKTLQTPLKFANCVQMWNTFDGGIRKSPSSVDKGSKGKKRSTFYAEGYLANQRLDSDKDGIVCER